MKRHNSKHKNESIDVSKLTTLEDLILAAMGPPNKNIVNFKMVQAILMILAQQLRMLERPVDYRSLEEDKTAQSEKENAERVGGEGVKAGRESEKSERDRGERPKAVGEREKSERDRGKEEKAEKKGEKPEREGERAKSVEESEKSEKDRGKEEKAGRKGEKSERDGERAKAVGESEKSEKDRGKEDKPERKGEKSERDGERGKAVGESEKSEIGRGKEEKAEREGEKSESDGERTKPVGESEKSEIDRGKKEKAVGESEKSEIDRGKKEKAEREGEKSESDGEGEKAERAREKSERDRGKGKKAETASQKSKRGGGKREKSERESEISERESENSETESDNSERESEKSGEKAGRKKEKTGRTREKRGQEREKTESEIGKEKKERGRDKETSGPEREKTGQEKERTGQKREKTEPEREKTGRKKEKTGPEREKEAKEKPMIEESYISVTDKDKVLVVEKLPTSRRGAPQSHVGSIPVVTLSQFKLLEATVKALEEKASPIPFPSMPDNQTLRDDIAKGNVSLTDTMQAMQVSARVQAAEEAINRMAELLTDMAAQGAVPTDLTGKMQSFAVDAKDPESRKRAPSTTPKGPKSSRSSVFGAKASRSSVFGAKGKKGGVLKPAKQGLEGAESEAQTEAPLPPLARKLNFVTHPQLNEALRVLKEGLVKNAFTTTTCAQKVADQSLKTVTTAVEKADIVNGMDGRIENLTKTLEDHGEQLAISDSAVTSQIDSFNATLAQLRTDLQEGIIMFQSMDNNAEKLALNELNEKYDNLVEILDMTLDSHRDLTSAQNQLNGDIQNILACVEMLQEEKSDRDEMLDRLRDKADISALDQMLPAQEFAMHLEILDHKLERCHDKFDRQETVWENALEELASMSDEKSDLLQLLKLKEDTEKQLNDINKKLRCLVFALGEPKAALLARQLSQGGRCGACSKPAIQDIMDKSYIKDANDKPFSKPVRLPSAFFSYMGAGDPCEVKTNHPSKDEAKQHVCNRWVGGSHTLINASVKHAEPEPMEAFEPTKKYCAYGDDGRLYNMEEPLDPCKHCSPQVDEEVLVDGAGDTDHMVHVHIIGGPQTADK